MRTLRRAGKTPWVDVAWRTALIEVAVVLGTMLAARNQPGAPLDPVAYAALAVTGGAYVLSRRWPLVAVGVAAAALVVYYGAGHPVDVSAPLGLLVALYVAADPDRPWRSVAVGVVSAAAVVAAQIAGSGPGSASPRAAAGHLAVAVWLAAALVLGHLGKGRRAQEARLAERLREDHAERRVTEERLRLARELHDVVSHSIWVINVQAGVAEHLLDRKPEHAREALRAIKVTSKEALRDLRGILGVLRQFDEAEPRAPTPGLEQLDVLVGTTTQAGLPVEVNVSGDRRRLPRAVDLTAYRVVQESLTNALRYAGQATAMVEVVYGSDAVRVEVSDDGRGAGAADGEGTIGSGGGLRGLRERVAALGGELHAGPREPRGFQVVARLPVEDVEA
jgi:signal transduction histidine kinase